MLVSTKWMIPKATTNVPHNLYKKTGKSISYWFGQVPIETVSNCIL